MDGIQKEKGEIYVKAVRSNGEIEKLVEITHEEFAKLSGLSIN